MKNLKKLSRNELKNLIGGGPGDTDEIDSGVPVCDITVVMCYNYNYKPKDNAYMKGKKWVCCPK